ncbi:MAG: right-handed parallel beta-helix repeat-containing protein [Planctomycetes bacterium]|nr:right-handed parallel beta-helix repeat-containing protein [Planctomycetota bacterium]
MNALLCSLVLACGAAADELPLVELTADDTVLTASARVRVAPGLVLVDDEGDGVVQVGADGVRLVFEPGSVLRGAPAGAAPDTFAGVGVRVEGHRDVHVEGLVVQGYKVGVLATGADGLVVRAADVSDNFAQRLRSTPERCDDGADWLACHDNDAAEWRTRYGAGIAIERSRGVVVRDCVARRTQNGLLLDRVSEAQVYDNDLSFLSGWGLGLWRSSDNVVARNAFDFCVRGYSHGVYNRGQDSAGVLVFEQCSRNVFAYNSATHGGDGVFGFAGSEALGQRPNLPADFDCTRRGNDDNVFLGNDFSYAAAHGLEMTFSFGNVVEGNRFVENAICGIWGGYSRGMLVRDNDFVANGEAGYGLERGGVNIEHSVENWIVGNRFERNACGVHLWWDEDAGLLETPWAQANSTACEDNVVAGNRFVGDAVALELRACRPVVVRDNVYDRVDVEVEAPERGVVAGALPALPAPLGALELPGRKQPVGARARLAGRANIVMGEWAPWDHASPFLQRSARAPGRDEWTLHAFPDDAEVRLVGEGVTLEHLPGEPRRIAVALKGRGFAPYVLRVGDQERRGVLQRLDWEVACFATPFDPREDEAAFRAAAADAEPQVLAELALDYAMGGPRDLGLDVADDVGREHFGTSARARVALAPGRYALTVTSDDGVRVWVGERLLVDDWSWHAPRTETREFDVEEAGEVELAVEHFELDGYAVLRLALEPLP